MPKSIKKTTKPTAKKIVKSKASVKKMSKTKTVSVKKAVKRKASVKKSASKKTVVVKKTKKKYDEVKSLRLWLFLVGFLLLLGLVLSNLYWSQDMEDINQPCFNLSICLDKPNEKVENPELTVGLANPASANCLDLGGNLELKNRANLGQYGVCVFPNGNECEEWALFNGDCPLEGIEEPAEGYRTVLEYYCAITGGEIDKETKECVFPEGQSCDLEDYYNGICHK